VGLALSNGVFDFCIFELMEYKDLSFKFKFFFNELILIQSGRSISAVFDGKSDMNAIITWIKKPFQLA